jgi:hypothetical protein
MAASETYVCEDVIEIDPHHAHAFLIHACHTETTDELWLEGGIIYLAARTWPLD